jgi:c-di-GMP-binding flagellar brake protein YcgR
MEKEGRDQDRHFGTVNFERRSYPRYSVNLPVEYWPTVDSNNQLGRTGDIGENGVMLYVREKIEVGQNLKLRLFIDSGFTFISIEALVEVVWKSLPSGQTEEHQMGVKLIDISDRDRANLNNFLNSLMDFKDVSRLDISPRLLSSLGIKTSVPK